ncbi:uncharacterized protein LOC108664658 [Hyalella azteca]|uniref:Uncharacterized protein LOC108664658 n=1 Tax=Hyalella azteca TaxID=294128 RepID=A0A8B7MZV5_HYAAZ|nr:uncharacterized protein LOC108664658 [Hyalella azteca]
MWNSQLPADQANATLQDILRGDQQALERNFTVRFRCLLDNTSGFLRLDIRGRVKVLVGQNRKTEEGAPLALFAVCTPFGPPSLLELPQKEVMYKSKHKLDLSLVSMDQRGKLLLGYSDLELANKGGYDLVHYDDLAYVACAHQELLKTGASGMIAYRLLTRDGSWQWLQTSSRLVYKNSKPDFIICTHRPLMEEEGRDLLGKRTMDFKVSYLDPGLTQSYLCDSELPQLMSRRYKTHLRDFLSTCRSKRSYNNIADPTYNNYSNVYSPSSYAADNTAASLYVNPQNLSNLPSLYPTSYIPTDNLFHYRQLGSYYPDYMTTHSYVSNGYMDPTRPCLGYDTSGLSKTTTTEQKFYCPSQLEASKYASQYYTANSVLPPLDHKYDLRASSVEFRREHTPLLAPPSPASTAPPPSVPPPTTPLTPVTDGGGIKDIGYSNGTRQTVLMWGSAESTAPLLPTPDYDVASSTIKKYSDSPSSNASNGSNGVANNQPCPYTSSNSTSSAGNHHSTVAGVQEVIPGAACKWGPLTAGSNGARSSSNGGSPHEGASPPGNTGVTGGKGGYYTTETGELWPPHQYYHHPYHHAYPSAQPSDEHLEDDAHASSLPPTPVAAAIT